MNDIVMARTSLFRQPASPPASQPARQPASPPASQPARIRQSNNQFFPSENLVKNDSNAIRSAILKLFQSNGSFNRFCLINKQKTGNVPLTERTTGNRDQLL
ncbi:hypothetical protein DPMN_099963 [Dreissena polymorpha]|uniref:Uncharacterized protein n=1 Tax=Dreissena polymorpha TaxID=45954 RepID=A0A9D4R6X5_DREPO|nr:hypothetical protein DPMN_099963 [Dreissena polymorpha]